MQVDMVDPQGVILREIADNRLTRDDIASTYAWCIRQRDECDFRVINQAILERWSLSGLAYIKKRAWKRFE